MMFRSLVVSVVLGLVAFQVTLALEHGESLKDRLQRRENAQLVDELLERLLGAKETKRGCQKPEDDPYCEQSTCSFDFGDMGYAYVDYPSRDDNTKMAVAFETYGTPYWKGLLDVTVNVDPDNVAATLPYTSPSFTYRGNQYKLQVANIVPGSPPSMTGVCVAGA